MFNNSQEQTGSEQKTVSFDVPQSKIGSIIGRSGRVIREIIEKTGTKIDINDNGVITVTGEPGESFDKAIDWIKILSGDVSVGKQYEGTINRSAEYGYFVDIAPGKTGLVHISTVPREDQEEFMRRYEEGDKVTVEVRDSDPSSGRIGLRIVEGA